MTNPESLSCFDCPTVCEIHRLLEESQGVRDATEQETLRVMDEFEYIDPSNEQAQALRERWVATSENVLTLLDKADASLNANLTALLETCEDMKPSIATNLGETALHCSSQLSEQVSLDIQLPAEA